LMHWVALGLTCIQLFHQTCQWQTHTFYPQRTVTGTCLCQSLCCNRKGVIIRTNKLVKYMYIISIPQVTVNYQYNKRFHVYYKC
jgi:hypothetical protein